MGLEEPFGVTVVKVFPLDNDSDRKGDNGPCPEGVYENERGEGHEITPIVDPAGVAALVLNEPPERAEDHDAELVHEHKEKDYDVDPGVAEHADHPPQAYVSQEKQPVKGGPHGAGVGLFFQGQKLFITGR